MRRRPKRLFVLTMKVLTMVLCEDGSILAGSDGDGICRVGTLPEPMSLAAFVKRTAFALDCGGVRFVDGGKSVSRVAVGGGACGEYVPAVLADGCDTFVTADLKYHGFLDAAALGLNLLDAGHFPTEDPVCARLIRLLQDRFPGLNVVKSTVHRDVVQFYVP